MYGFGLNENGQLGNGDMLNVFYPEQLSNEPIMYIKAIGDTSFMVSQSGCLYTWPLSDMLKPIRIALKGPVCKVSCGN